MLDEMFIERARMGLTERTIMYFQTGVVFAKTNLERGVNFKTSLTDII